MMDEGLTHFDDDFRKWLNVIEDGCNRLGKIINLDYYPFQSAVREHPELMLIGANPGGEGPFKGERTFCLDDLKNGTNEFVNHYDDPPWHRMRSLYGLFKGSPIENVFKDAVITNIVYFNSSNFASFKKKPGWQEAYKFCRDQTLELIKIVKPRRIIIMGNPALKGLKSYFDKPVSPILLTKEEWHIIRETTLLGIPTYWIHHPCLNHRYNSGDNFEKKKKRLHAIFG